MGSCIGWIIKLWSESNISTSLLSLKKKGCRQQAKKGFHVFKYTICKLFRINLMPMINRITLINY